MLLLKIIGQIISAQWVKADKKCFYAVFKAHFVQYTQRAMSKNRASTRHMCTWVPRSCCWFLGEPSLCWSIEANPSTNSFLFILILYIATNIIFKSPRNRHHTAEHQCWSTIPAQPWARPKEGLLELEEPHGGVRRPRHETTDPSPGCSSSKQCFKSFLRNRV